MYNSKKFQKFYSTTRNKDNPSYRIVKSIVTELGCFKTLFIEKRIY